MATKGKSKKTTIKKSVVSKTKSTTLPVKAYKMKKSHAISLIVILVIVALIYSLRSFIVAATVNGQPITRLSIVKEAEKQVGKQALDSLVRNTLIEQEAKKQKITVTDKEINDEIKKVEESVAKQGKKLDEVLALQGWTREQVRKDIRLNKLVTKMVGKDVKITDKEINDYIETNKDSLPQGQTDDQLRKTVKDQLTQQALGTKVQAWLAELQKKAKIQYFVSY